MRVLDALCVEADRIGVCVGGGEIILKRLLFAGPCTAPKRLVEFQWSLIVIIVPRV